jgi:protein phosphatase
VLIPELRFVAVLDGTGGPESGQWAADGLQQAVRRHLGASPQGLLDAANEVRQRLSAISSGQSPQRGFTATFAAAHFEDDAVSMLNAGDVQAFRFLRGEAPVGLLKQHLFGNMVRERFPEATEADVEKFKHVITQTLLYPENGEFESTRIALSPGELLLICTDGVYAYVAPEAVQRAWEALPTPTLDMRADLLERMILAGEAKDNYAFVLVSI